MARLWLALFLLGASSAQAAELVRARLIADTRAVASGQAFRLGVLFEIEPGWHIYWKEPGDSGLATSVKFALPAGFSAGELSWPLHQSWTLEGGILNNGYADSVLLFSEVRPPGGLSPGEAVPLQAEARWLACKEVCVPGRSSLRLELPAAGRSEPDNQQLFSAWQSKVPAAVQTIK